MREEQGEGQGGGGKGQDGHGHNEGEEEENLPEDRHDDDYGGHNQGQVCTSPLTPSHRSLAHITLTN